MKGWGAVCVSSQKLGHFGHKLVPFFVGAQRKQANTTKNHHKHTRAHQSTSKAHQKHHFSRVAVRSPFDVIGACLCQFDGVQDRLLRNCLKP
jgi:hypothetical protein